MSRRTDLEAQGFKTYENEEISVFWNPSICQHAAKCVGGSHDVFDPKRRPWIDLSKASAKDISAIIDHCPLHALQYELKNTVTIVFEEQAHRSAAYKYGNLIGECEFTESENAWTITHTGVRPSYEGQGIARRLVESVIEAARQKKMKIVPLCSYAKKMMVDQKEYADVLK